MGNIGVYAIRHVPSGALYVGSSNNIKRRWGLHTKQLQKGLHHSRYLQRAWDKYGAQSFVFDVMLICDVNNLTFYEQLCIDRLGPAYNVSKNASGPVHRGQKLTSEWRDRVAKSVQDRYDKGFVVNHPPRSDDYRAHVSRVSTKRWEDVQWRAATVAAIRNSMSPEVRAAKSKKASELWANPEYRAKSIAARLGHSYNKGYKCSLDQIKNRQRAARISNMRRYYGDQWKEEYARRYPEHIRDLDG